MANRHKLAASDTEFGSMVRLYEDKFSRTDYMIADFLLKHEDSVGDYSIQMMADEIGVGVASIIRFSKVLGYQGFADMKFKIQQGRIAVDKLDIGVNQADEINMVKQKILHFLEDYLERCILDLNNQTIADITNAIIASKKVYIYGSGTAATISETIAALFTYNGIFAYTISDSMLHLRSLAFLEKGDVLIAINYSGYSKDICDSIYFAQQAGVTTVLFTARKNSLAGKYADFEILIPPRNQNNSVNVAGSTICQLAITQIIQAIIQQRSIAEFEKRTQHTKKESQNTYYDLKQDQISNGRVKIVQE